MQQDSLAGCGGSLLVESCLFHRHDSPRLLGFYDVNCGVCCAQAIDLVDESAAKLKMEITSKPTHLDEIDRKILQLEMERLSLAKVRGSAGHGRGRRSWPCNAGANRESRSSTGGSPSWPRCSALIRMVPTCEQCCHPCRNAAHACMPLVQTKVPEQCLVTRYHCVEARAGLALQLAGNCFRGCTVHYSPRPLCSHPIYSG